MTFPTSDRDADAQLTAARAAALAWLRATLAALPAAVTSLSVGAVFEDPNDVPDLAPRLRATIAKGNLAETYPDDRPGLTSDREITAARRGIFDLDDDLRTHTRPFLFALGDEEWLTVTRADLARSAWVSWPTSPGWWWLARPGIAPHVIVEASAGQLGCVVWFAGNEVENFINEPHDGWCFAPVRETPPVFP